MPVLGPWNDRVWHAQARIRFCHAYCVPETNLFAPFHNPSCAYATARWLDSLRREIRTEMLRA